MEIQQDHNYIVIVGAGISGLSTALGLHRLGFRSIVLESSNSLRTTGFALTIWKNGWKALDALGVADSLRHHCLLIHGFSVASDDHDSGLSTSKRSAVEANQNFRENESRCIRRKDLLEKLEKELPADTIKYSSKVVSIEELGHLKMVHLADGSKIKTKVLIGCDGVNSVVAKWLGLGNAVHTGRSAIRGIVAYPNGGHGFEPKFYAYFGRGVRFGFLPCDQQTLYWFFTFRSYDFQSDETESHELMDNVDPVKMKGFVSNKLQNAPHEMQEIVGLTRLDCISSARLKLRLPWQLLFGNIVKDNVCVAGDALHPMTPDIAQGGCSALEDSVVLARCLAEALSPKPKEEEIVLFGKIKRGLGKYASERRWRSFSLITTAYLVGLIQQSNGKLMRFIRDKFLVGYTIKSRQRMSDFQFGKLTVS